MNDFLPIILKDIFSLNQYKTRVRLLKSNLLKTFFGGENEISLSLPQELNWLKSLPEDFYQKFNKDNVYQIFSNLDKEIAKLPTLTILLTFEPDDTILSNLGTFARNMFGLPLMLDIKFDPRLIAGAVLIWKGVYRDYSLRAKIEEKKVVISESFKKFLR